jgi:opacity protein-like surface antigen
MKMDAPTSVALCLLVATTAAAQNAAPEQTAPAPQQNAPVSPPPPGPPAAPPVQATPLPPQTARPAAPPAQPATPPLPRLPSQQYQYAPPPQSPPPPQYKYQYAPPPPPAQQTPPPPPPTKPQWVHSESTYPDTGFKYHPFRFHVDGGATLTQNANDTLLDNGWNVGLGLSWFPSAHLPLGIRVDGTYNEFDARPGLVNQATATYGTRVDEGTRKLWGGDVDLELDLHLSSHVRAYLLAGGGWYKQQDTFRQVNFYPGYICDWWGCGPGYYGVRSLVARNTSDWRFAKNAGFGLEFAMGPKTSFFVEARYMRLNPNDAKSDYLPIKAGLRF